MEWDLSEYTLRFILSRLPRGTWHHERGKIIMEQGIIMPSMLLSNYFFADSMSPNRDGFLCLATRGCVSFCAHDNVCIVAAQCRPNRAQCFRLPGASSSP